MNDKNYTIANRSEKNVALAIDRTKSVSEQEIKFAITKYTRLLFLFTTKITFLSIFLTIDIDMSISVIKLSSYSY